MRIRSYLERIPSPKQGFCHGDFHAANAHLTEGNTVTFFDFDCCGFGYRAYDIAIFKWDSRLMGKEKETERWEAFLRGYMGLRDLSLELRGNVDIV